MSSSADVDYLGDEAATAMAEAISITSLPPSLDQENIPPPLSSSQMSGNIPLPLSSPKSSTRENIPLVPSDLLTGLLTMVPRIH